MHAYIIAARKWLIRRLAGRMGVALNVSLGVDRDRGPYISYASVNGGLCELKRD